MSAKKGKLRNPEGTVDSTGYNPRLSMPGARDIIEVKEESWFSIFLGWGKGILAFIVIVVFILAILYSGLAATLMVYSPLSSDASITDREWVIRNAWSETGNTPPVDEEVIISTVSETPEEFWNLIMIGWIGITNPATVKVISTDYDKVLVDENSRVALGSNPERILGTFSGSAAVQYDATKNPSLSYQLKDELLVECVAGDCTPGSIFIITEKQIFGKERV